VAFGNGAQALQEQCQPGQWFIFEGRLRINTIERPEGFKEKQVELSISHFYPMGNPPAPATAPASASAQVMPPVVASRKVPAMAGADAGAGVGGGAAVAVAPDYDDIPF
jgi:single-stranded DNA-binding protein